MAMLNARESEGAGRNPDVFQLGVSGCELRVEKHGNDSGSGARVESHKFVRDDPSPFWQPSISA
jgi:hypothetical protein